MDERDHFSSFGFPCPPRGGPAGRRNPFSDFRMDRDSARFPPPPPPSAASSWEPHEPVFASTRRHFHPPGFPDDHRDVIPIKVIHEKTPSSSGKVFKGRNTTEIPRHVEKPESPRLERASSEPPKLFAQKLERIHPQTPIPESDKSENRAQISTSASAPSVPPPSDKLHTKSPSPPPPHSAHPPSSTSSNVRHIPIIVEGRDSPVYNRKFSDPDLKKPSDFYPSPKRGAQVRPDTVHKKNAPTTTQESNNSVPIPMGCSPQHMKLAKDEPTSPLPMPEGPIPLPCSPNLMPKTEKDVPDAKASPSPPRDNTRKVSDPALEKVNAIKDHLNDVIARINAFKGSKNDKEYLYLDEVLTKYLLELDCIDSGGREEIRKLRRESIKSVNRCLSLLDSQAKADNTAAVNNEILSDLANMSNNEKKN